MKKLLLACVILIIFSIHSSSNQENSSFRTSQYKEIPISLLRFTHPDLGHPISDLHALRYLAQEDTELSISKIERVIAHVPSITLSIKIDPFNNTLLTEAALWGSINLIQYLLNRPDIKDTDINAQTTNGTTALMHVAKQKTDKNTSIAKLLLEKGADPFIKDINEKSALAIAIDSYNAPIAHELIYSNPFKDIPELETYKEKVASMISCLQQKTDSIENSLKIELLTEIQNSLNAKCILRFAD